MSYTAVINLKQKVINRDYPVQLVNIEIDKCLFIHRKDTLTYKTPEKKN